MKTTLKSGDDLLAETRQLVATDDISLRAPTEAGLRPMIDQQRQPAAPYRLRRVTTKGYGLQPASVDSSWDELRELALGELWAR